MMYNWEVLMYGIMWGILSYIFVIGCGIFDLFCLTLCINVLRKYINQANIVQHFNVKIDKEWEFC